MLLARTQSTNSFCSCADDSRVWLSHGINTRANNVKVRMSYTVESSILVLRVDLFDVTDDVVIQRLAEQFVRTSEKSETQLK